MSTLLQRAACVWITALALGGGVAYGSDDEACLECHAEMEGETFELADGSTIDLFVDSSRWEESVHGGKLSCTDCHRRHGDHPHEPVRTPDARTYQIEVAKTCHRCHYAYYTRVLDGIHYEMLERGVQGAPTCVDCHGSHGVRSPGSPRIEVDRRCSKCHAEISATYKRSVHGKALVEDSSEDVPVCTDCHGAHAIRDPRRPEFHTSEHTICARCHGDAERMARYGLNPNVARSYLQDFHGVSNRLYTASESAPEKLIATCTDCHGVHDIAPFDASGDTQAVKERVAVLCRRCHEGATPAFADAWLLHYEPTLQSAPLVWGVRMGYRVLIPLIMAGLVLHILLDLWRVRAHRYAGRGHEPH